MEPIICNVKFPDGSLKEIEFAFIQNKDFEIAPRWEENAAYRRRNNISIITLYENRIYKSIPTIESYHVINMLFSKQYTKEFDKNRFSIRDTYDYVMSLTHYPDNDNMIGRYIRENGLFGTKDELYVLK